MKKLFPIALIAFIAVLGTGFKKAEVKEAAKKSATYVHKSSCLSNKTDAMGYGWPCNCWK
jgi:hypothetical protein